MVQEIADKVVDPLDLGFTLNSSFSGLFLLTSKLLTDCRLDERFPVAGDFVERDVKRSFPFRRQIDDADVRLRLTLLDQDLQPLVSADEVAAALIPHQRFDAAELIDAPLELVVLRIAGFRFLRGL